MQYQVQFATTGTYYVWLRAENDSGTDDSIHVGVDGQAVNTADRISLSTRLAWAWFQGTMDGPVATVTIASAGQHTINVWMREDGFRLDRLLLTTSSTYVPSSSGPAESPRVGAATPTQAPTATSTPTATPASSTRLKMATFENASLTDAQTGFSTTSGTVSRETANPLKDTASFRVPNNSTGYGTISFANTDEIFVTMYVRWTAAAVRSRPAIWHSAAAGC